MNSFNSDPRQRRERRVEFIREQSGQAEDDLKQQLLPVLRRHGAVERAYLAQVGFAPGSALGISLCLAPASARQRAIVDEVGVVFSGLFDAGQDLDVMFISKEQEEDLARVAAPFYERPGTR